MSETHAHSTVVILDFGSQYSKLITRKVRELGVYSFALPGDATLERIRALNPKAVILSGGPSSVTESESPRLNSEFWSWQQKQNIPVLGVCYGLQLMVHDLGGKVHASGNREYGKADLSMVKDSQLFSFFKSKRQLSVWMSHGDHVDQFPDGFEVIGKTDSGVTAVIENKARKLMGLQFHPEVTHTQNGMDILKGFLIEFAQISADWKMSDLEQEQIAEIKNKVGPDDHVICALSGGVDSTVAAVLVHQALGDRLHCVFVDHGLLRLNEQQKVMQMFQDKLHLPVDCVDASDRFLSKLAGVEDPEKKRKIIGAEFIAVFDEYAKGLEQKLGQVPKYLVQGTLYPDVIESAGISSGSKHSHKIKSHHNVGGLPKDLKFELIEPLRDLFKDEVRKLGKELKIPDSFLQRHPFPGPGLAVRIIGDITTERVKILQQVDDIFIQGLHDHGLYDKIWQAFAVFLPIKSVGVQGDGRTHDHVVGLRAITSQDGMTADWYPFEPTFLAKVSNQICNEVRGVNRVVYDISSKPPATIEWE